MRTLAVSLGLLLLLAACEGPAGDGGSGTAGDGSPGRISVALSEDAEVAAGFQAWLRIQAPGVTTPLVERESTVGPLGRWAEVVYVPQGTWDVLLDLIGPDGVAVWSGAARDVPVYPGELTTLELALDPAGGLVVVADLAAGAGWFEIGGNQTTTAATPVNVSSSWNLSGFAWRAPEDGVRRYYVTRCDKTDGNSLKIFGTTAPVNYTTTNSPQVVLAGSVPGTATWADWCTKPYAITAAGPVVYLAYVDTSAVKILRSPGDLTVWQLFAVLPVTRAARPLATNPGVLKYDAVEGCSLLVDDRFHLFCLAKEWRTGAADYDWRIAQATSTDGTVWSELLPYEDLDDATALAADATVRRLPANRTLVRLQAESLGGVYHLWLLTSGPTSGTTGSAASFVHAVSGNGRDWSALDEELGLAPAAALTRPGPTDPRSLREFVMFRTASQWELVYRSNTSYLSRAVDTQ
jgi:hypothetical protein